MRRALLIHSQLPIEITLPEGARKCLLRRSRSRCGSSCNGRRRSRGGRWRRSWFSHVGTRGAASRCCLRKLLPIHCGVGQRHTTPQPVVTFLSTKFLIREHGGTCTSSFILLSSQSINQCLLLKQQPIGFSKRVRL